MADETPVILDTLPVEKADTPTDARLDQETVNKIVGEARRKARETARAELLKELDVEDVALAAQLVKKQREQDEAAKSETTKALEAAVKEKTRADALQADFDAYRQQVDTERRIAARDTAIKAALTTAGAKADKVLRLLDTTVLEGVMTEGGIPDDKKVAALVEVARKQYPEDFQPTRIGTPSHAGGVFQKKVDPKQVKTSGHL